MKELTVKDEGWKLSIGSLVRDLAASKWEKGKIVLPEINSDDVYKKRVLTFYPDTEKIPKEVVEENAYQTKYQGKTVWLTKTTSKEMTMLSLDVFKQKQDSYLVNRSAAYSHIIDSNTTEPQYVGWHNPSLEDLFEHVKKQF